MSEWGRGIVYVVHCVKCNCMVKQADRDRFEDGGPCPKKRYGPLKNGAPVVSFGSHKQDMNYPQVAPNLPGNGVVTSWNDYQRKLKASDQKIVGMSDESRCRARHSKRRRPQDSARHKDYQV